MKDVLNQIRKERPKFGSVIIVLLLFITITPLLPSIYAQDVTTNEPADIGWTKAVLSANVTLNGESEVTLRFNYRENGTEAWINSDTADISANGTYTIEIEGLSSNTVYQYRANISYIGNYTNGDIETFKTLEYADGIRQSTVFLYIFIPLGILRLALSAVRSMGNKEEYGRYR